MPPKEIVVIFAVYMNGPKTSFFRVYQAEDKRTDPKQVVAAVVVADNRGKSYDPKTEVPLKQSNATLIISGACS